MARAIRLAMLRAVGSAVLLGGMATLAANAPPETEAAIKAVVTPWLRPAERFQSVDWENAFGGRKQGIQELEAFLDARVRPTMASMRVEVLEVRIMMVTPDVAVADKYLILKDQTDGPDGPVLPDRKVRDTYVLHRVDGNWNVVAERISDLRT